MSVCWLRNASNYFATLLGATRRVAVLTNAPIPLRELVLDHVAVARAYYRHRDSTNHGGGLMRTSMSLRLMTKGQAALLVIQGSLSTERIRKSCKRAPLRRLRPRAPFGCGGWFRVSMERTAPRYFGRVRSCA